MPIHHVQLCMYGVLADAGGARIGAAVDQEERSYHFPTGTYVSTLLV